MVQTLSDDVLKVIYWAGMDELADLDIYVDGRGWVSVQECAVRTLEQPNGERFEESCRRLVEAVRDAGRERYDKEADAVFENTMTPGEALFAQDRARIKAERKSA